MTEMNLGKIIVFSSVHEADRAISICRTISSFTYLISRVGNHLVDLESLVKSCLSGIAFSPYRFASTSEVDLTMLDSMIDQGFSGIEPPELHWFSILPILNKG